MVPVEPDAALLLCSDGLSDLVPAGDDCRGGGARLRAIRQRVVDGLVEAANRAGGKDNVTAVYVEGERHAAAAAAAAAARGRGPRGGSWCRSPRPCSSWPPPAPGSCVPVSCPGRPRRCR